MNRTNRKHSRNIQRQRRNKGPEMLSQAADNKLQEHAPAIASALCDAALGSNAIAAGLLLGLAESAEYAESAPAVRQACSIFEQWAREPETVMLDNDPRLGAAPQPRLLTDGAGGNQPPASEEIIEAEVS